MPEEIAKAIGILASSVGLFVNMSLLVHSSIAQNSVREMLEYISNASFYSGYLVLFFAIYINKIIKRYKKIFCCVLALIGLALTLLPFLLSFSLQVLVLDWLQYLFSLALAIGLTTLAFSQSIAPEKKRISNFLSRIAAISLLLGLILVVLSILMPILVGINNLFR